MPSVGGTVQIHLPTSTGSRWLHRCAYAAQDVSAKVTTVRESGNVDAWYTCPCECSTLVEIFNVPAGDGDRQYTE